ncbi:MAG TPA: FAD-dependent oxidoreductase [Amycolatopsis sp.]|nr:FAD-dependent oxidoreductase [Amycolatopsis sp.]
MAHVVTQSCCNDATCVSVCPVNCIHPAPDEPGYGTAEMLHIDPATCIDCGACVDVCPVDAIKAGYELTPETVRYREINARYFSDPRHRDYAPEPVDRARAGVAARLRVAIVGSGPSACYAAEDLLTRGAEVTMVERLLTPWGLVRFGVAPDHPHTKQVTRLFTRTAARERLTLHLGVEVGKDITHEELLAHHHGVIYAVGAAGDRKLGVAGEDLAGCHSATGFVAWYNGHPDFRHARFDLSGRRAVVVGNGNVALDVARILVSDVDTLARTDIADHALEALAGSGIEEVVVLGRRGPEQAAYTTPELLALGDLSDVDIVAEGPLEGSGLKVEIVRELASRPRRGKRRIVLRYLASLVEIFGEGRVTGIRLGRNELTGSGAARDTGEREVLDCELVLTSIGYRADPLPGLPFDHARAILPTESGRVVGAPGVYATGWIKRGPSGVIGTNRKCAEDTVSSLLRDFESESLPEPAADAFDALIRARRPDAIGFSGWKAIDRLERGSAPDRPRRKLVDPAEQLAAARAGDLR